MKTKAMIFGAALVFSVTPGVRAGGQPTLDQLLGGRSPAAVSQPAGSEVPVVPGVPDAGPAGDSAEAVFGRAIVHMREASDGLGQRLDAGLTTQRLEQAVMTLMDKAIAELQQKQANPKTDPSDMPIDPTNPFQKIHGEAEGPQNTPQTSPSNSSQRGQTSDAQPAGGDPGGIKIDGQRPKESLGSIEEIRKLWGTLPERTRQQITQGLGERGSPLYEELTSDYYKHVAEGNRR